MLAAKAGDLGDAVHGQIESDKEAEIERLDELPTVVLSTQRTNAVRRGPSGKATDTIPPMATGNGVIPDAPPVERFFSLNSDLASPAPITTVWPPIAKRSLSLSLRSAGSSVVEPESGPPRRAFATSFKKPSMFGFLSVLGSSNAFQGRRRLPVGIAYGRAASRRGRKEVLYQSKSPIAAETRGRSIDCSHHRR